jgi:hypothetical protein
VTDKSGKTFRVTSGYVDERGGKWPFDARANIGAKSDDGFVWSSGFFRPTQRGRHRPRDPRQRLPQQLREFPVSLGDLFQGDNDDSQSCRTSFVLEYGSAGYTTPTGGSDNSVKRPGQPMPRAHWRQDDPDTMDVGDVYGGGSPTGITVYENGALGAAFEGTLLNCEPSRNTVLAYSSSRRRAPTP